MVCVFENCGEAVGVTMPHPHGQIYAIPFIAPIVEKEIESARLHAETSGGECLFCRLLRKSGRRNRASFQATSTLQRLCRSRRDFQPNSAIYARRHVRTLLDLTAEERASLARNISVIRRKYDDLYGFMLPLMMAVKQAPLQDSSAPYHFHVQFLPLQRSATKSEISGHDGDRVWKLSWRTPLRKKWRKICEMSKPETNG